MLDSLVATVDNKDRYTRRHSEDVARYARLDLSSFPGHDLTVHNRGGSVRVRVIEHVEMLEASLAHGRP